jgi:hypothetical protein
MKKLADYRKLFIYITTLLFAIQPVFSQIPEISWEKDFKIKSSHYFSDAMELPGGNFILLGAIEKAGDRSFDVWLLECNSQGDTLRTKVFENPGNDIPLRIVSNGEDGYIIASLNQSTESGLLSRLLAVDSALSELWVTVAEKPSVLLRTDVAVDNEGQIWWLNTFGNHEEKSEVTLWKLNTKGNKTDEFKFDDNLMAAGYSIRLLQDGTLGISCQVQPPKGKPTVQILRISTDGKLLWKSLVPQSDKLLTPQCLCCSPDNTLLVGGWAALCYNPDAPAEEQIWDYDYLLTKLDAAGKVLWTQNYNREGSEKGTAIAVLPDGNIMAAGKCETSFTGSIGPWLLFIDKNGKMVKDQVFKFRFVHDQASRIVCTSDGGLLMIGPGFIDTEQHLSGWVKKLSPAL